MGAEVLAERLMEAAKDGAAGADAGGVNPAHQKCDIAVLSGHPTRAKRMIYLRLNQLYTLQNPFSASESIQRFAQAAPFGALTQPNPKWRCTGCVQGVYAL